MESLPLFDREQALAAVDGDEDVMQEIVTLFRSTVTGDLAELAAAFAQDAWEDATDKAHGIKGAAGTVGAARVSAAAARVEMLLKQGQRDDARAMTAALTDEVERFNALPV